MVREVASDGKMIRIGDGRPRDEHSRQRQQEIEYFPIPNIKECGAIRKPKFKPLLCLEKHRQEKRPKKRMLLWVDMAR